MSEQRPMRPWFSRLRETSAAEWEASVRECFGAMIPNERRYLSECGIDWDLPVGWRSIVELALFRMWRTCRELEIVPGEPGYPTVALLKEASEGDRISLAVLSRDFEVVKALDRYLGMSLRTCKRCGQYAGPASGFEVVRGVCTQCVDRGETT